jgi:predicted amidohydrolase
MQELSPKKVRPFVAVAIQCEVRAHYYTGKDAKAQRMENVRRYGALLDKFIPEIGAAQGPEAPEIGLVVFPESFIHGFGKPPVTWEKMQELAITLPGEETEVLAEKCREYKVYLAGSCFECGDPKFPGKIFNTGFILDPEGKVALKYRKINTSNNSRELSTSPHDVWDQYSHDPEVLFPVLETPYGNFGMYICFDANFPEVARCVALNGAEILIRPNNWPRPTVEFLDIMKMHNRMRAYENSCYLVTCNWAASPLSEYESTCAHAMIVDYRGNIVTERIDNVEGFVQTTIDVNPLRAMKEKVYRWNFLMELRSEVYATAYCSKKCFPPNKYLDPNKNQTGHEEKWEIFRESIENLKSQRIMRH